MAGIDHLPNLAFDAGVALHHYDPCIGACDLPAERFDRFLASAAPRKQHDIARPVLDHVFGHGPTKATCPAKNNVSAVAAKDGFGYPVNCLVHGSVSSQRDCLHFGVRLLTFTCDHPSTITTPSTKPRRTSPSPCGSSDTGKTLACISVLMTPLSIAPMTAWRVCSMTCGCTAATWTMLIEVKVALTHNSGRVL